MNDWETIKHLEQVDAGAFISVIVERHPDYELRIQRRKKEKPMPEIECKDVIHIESNGKSMVVYQRYTYTDNILAIDFNAKSHMVDPKTIHIIYRDGKEIWRRA